MEYWRHPPVYNIMLYRICNDSSDRYLVAVWTIIPHCYRLNVLKWPSWIYQVSTNVPRMLEIKYNAIFIYIGTASSFGIRQYIKLHYIRNARLKTIRSFEWYLPITASRDIYSTCIYVSAARPNHFWYRNIRTTFFYGNIAQLHQFTYL